MSSDKSFSHCIIVLIIVYLLLFTVLLLIHNVPGILLNGKD